MTSRIPKYLFPLLLLTLVLATVLPSCLRTRHLHEKKKPYVMVSILPLEYFVRAIGGDDIIVTSFADGDVDPESFEPSITQMRKAANADLFISVGLFIFEDDISRILAEEKPDLRVVTVKDSVDLIMGTHGHDEADPHVWVSYRNARVIAREVAAALEKQYPEIAPALHERWASLDSRLDSLDRATAAQLAPLQGSSFLIWHPSLSYYARDYGLHQIPVGSEHLELSVNKLRSRLEAASKYNARVFFYQQYSHQSEVVSAETGLKAVRLYPLSPDIEFTLSNATDDIVRGTDQP